jgi:hypothetical protein
MTRTRGCQPRVLLSATPGLRLVLRCSLRLGSGTGCLYSLNCRYYAFPATRTVFAHEEGPRLPLHFGLTVTLRARCTLAVPLRRLFDRRCRPLQVLRCHHRMDLYGGVQAHEKGFRHSGDLGGVVHVKDEVSTPCAFHVREVRRLGVNILKYGSNGLAEVPLANSFPFSVGKRNVSMKRICITPSRPKENFGGLSPLPTVLMSPSEDQRILERSIHRAA